MGCLQWACKIGTQILWCVHQLWRVMSKHPSLPINRATARFAWVTILLPDSIQLPCAWWLHLDGMDSFSVLDGTTAHVQPYLRMHVCLVYIGCMKPGLLPDQRILFIGFGWTIVGRHITHVQHCSSVSVLHISMCSPHFWCTTFGIHSQMGRSCCSLIGTVSLEY